ncbi:MAG: hypothetical protein IJX55_05865 [Clostridia bacterium]|nr:hypothetical protein [Clostridia bacterium]
MKTILQKLWNCEYEPLEHDGPNKKLLSESYGAMDENKLYLKKELNGKQLAAFLKYEEEANEVVFLSMEDSFVRGVRFAVRFFMEALEE